MNLYDIKIKTYSVLERVAGTENLERLFIRYYTHIAEKKGLHFFHIPKSAGTSICQLIYKRRIGHFSAQDIINVKGNEYFNRVHSFTVVRHPVDRLISAYRFAHFGGNMGAVKDQPFYRSDKRFRSFDAFVNEWLVYEDLMNTQIIFRPQYSFVYDRSQNLVPQDVFKIESPLQIEQTLTSKLNTEVILGNLNRSENKGIEVISQETLKVIEKLYRADFDLFNYK